MSNLTNQNFYELLEVSPEAPQHEIVRAYQKAKDTYSSDSPALYTMFSKAEAIELRNLVEEAFQVLGNMTKRREYDKSLNRETVEPNLPDFPAAEQRPSAQNNSSASSNTNPNSVVPDGFKKHKFGVYEVKPEVEAEISNCEEFDGALIRKVRLYKNINMEQLSKETRISRTYLNAIENEDYEALPAAVFVRGFLVQASKILGLDDQKVANTYMSRFKK
jgi:curved DNA-binding protein CbpA